MEKSYNAAELQHTFLAAMAGGYASGRVPQIIPGLPDWKKHETIISGTHSYSVTDIWTANDEGFGSGVTTLKDGPKLLWIMHYGGWYEPEAIPCLQKALYKAYFEEPVFNGGRGPKFFKHEGFFYINNPICTSEFKAFSGEEYIYGLIGGNPKLFGHHWYRGQCMTTFIR